MIKSGGKISYEWRGDCMVIHVGGEIDHHSAASIRMGVDQAIAAERPPKVMLELSSVDFMDSSGLGLIMGRFAIVKQYGGSFSVLDPAEAVVKIMKLAGMERMIPILRTKTRPECK